MNCSFRLLSRRSLPRGFTLIELLVVIVIIAVLAGIIIPAVATVQRKAKQTTSVSNLKQWYSGFSTSVADNEGEMPTYGGPTFNIADPAGWYNRMPLALKMQPYSTFDVSTRPGYGQKSVWINPGVSQKEASAGGFIFHYGFNDLLVESDAGSIRPMKIARVQVPHATVLMGEKADSQPGLNGNSVRTYWNANDPVSDNDGFANFLFVDGHVDLVKRSVFQGASANDPTYLDRNATNLSWQPFGQAMTKD